MQEEEEWSNRPHSHTYHTLIHSLSHVDRHMEVNLYSFIRVTKAFLPLLKVS